MKLHCLSNTQNQKLKVKMNEIEKLQLKEHQSPLHYNRKTAAAICWHHIKTEKQNTITNLFKLILWVQIPCLQAKLMHSWNSLKIPLFRTPLHLHTVVSLLFFAETLSDRPRSSYAPFQQLIGCVS